VRGGAVTREPWNPRRRRTNANSDVDSGITTRPDGTGDGAGVGESVGAGGAVGTGVGGNVGTGVSVGLGVGVAIGEGGGEPVCEVQDVVGGNGAPQDLPNGVQKPTL
jgi:hypothetical protein